MPPSLGSPGLKSAAGCHSLRGREEEGAGIREQSEICPRTLELWHSYVNVREFEACEGEKSSYRPSHFTSYEGKCAPRYYTHTPIHLHICVLIDLHSDTYFQRLEICLQNEDQSVLTETDQAPFPKHPNPGAPLNQPPKAGMANFLESYAEL